jgi:hypothetical protein
MDRQSRFDKHIKCGYTKEAAESKMQYDDKLIEYVSNNNNKEQETFDFDSNINGNGKYWHTADDL